MTLGHVQARSLGNPRLPIAMIPHPFGLRTRDEVRAIAQDCAEEIAELLAGVRQ